MNLSIVIPCFNEEKAIPILLEKYYNISLLIPLQLILVDNGSTDNTKGIIETKKLDPKFNFVTFLRIEKNVGYGHGIMFGIKHTKTDFIGFTHSDLQCDPDDILKAYNRILEIDPNDTKVLIKGRRIERRKEEKWISAKLDSIASFLFFRKFHDINGQPKVFHRSLLDSYIYYPVDITFDVFVTYKTKQLGYQIIDFPVYFHKRQFGKSSWNTSVLKRWKTILSFFKTILFLVFKIYK
ncbi:glycosyltransferase family 2 protein [Pigmentibacter sp. JX0631]|uniref:glycosyltransferase family 2 protein n=1 Tax=Pigmentibacter sp. JX0631 TaxID=2976982 RepID=UPI002468CA32|nr:glycosyltransferase family 2 protein [Pigmentibacter sp. JX0631]WGL60802.1 glycosyltransferase family 2 protein [Pigmentibacter sp. JX0631]